MQRLKFPSASPIRIPFPSLDPLARALAQAGQARSGDQPGRPTSGTLLGDLPEQAAATPDSFIDSDGDEVEVDVRAKERATRDHRQSVLDRNRVNLLIFRLRFGFGVPPFLATQPPVPVPAPDPGDEENPESWRWRYDSEVLELRTQRAFLAGEHSGFELHLHGEGVVARRDGQWVQSLDENFFQALELASNPPGYQP